MSHNQGGLTGIESISGVTPVDSSVGAITLVNTDYNYTKSSAINNQTQFLGLTASGHRVNFSGATFDQMFNDQNYVGGNMLTSDETMRQRYMNSGAGMNLYGMA